MDLKFAGRVRLGIIDGNVARIWYVTKRILSPQAAAFDAAFILSFFLSRLLTAANANKLKHIQLRELDGAQHGFEVRWQSQDRDY